MTRFLRSAASPKSVIPGPQNGLPRRRFSSTCRVQIWGPRSSKVHDTFFHMLMKHLLKYQESNLSNELLFQCMSPKRAEINDPKWPENSWDNTVFIVPPFALLHGSCSKFTVYHLDFGNRFFSRNPASKCSTKGPLAALASLQNERNGSWSLVSWFELGLGCWNCGKNGHFVWWLVNL